MGYEGRQIVPIHRVPRKFDLLKIILKKTRFTLNDDVSLI
jgi:hypothetical protein